MSDPDDDDEEALTWAGARDPSLYETPEPKGASAPRARRRKPGSYGSAATGTATNAGSGSVSDDGAEDRDHDDDDEPASLSGAVLISLGVLGGLFALYTAGWFVSWLKLDYSPSDALELEAFRVQQVLAILAAPVWFVTVMLLTRGRRAAVRLLWLVIGAILLVPWPWILER